MSSTICWHCHQLAQMVEPDEAANNMLYKTVNGYLPHFPDQRFVKTDNWLETESLVVYSCVNCGFPNIAVTETTAQEMSPYSNPISIIKRWLPVEPIGKEFLYAPNNIAEIANEVHKCLEINANRAAVTLARSVIESIVNDQEDAHSNESLYIRLQTLANQGKLKKRTVEAATAIRLCGNNSVHETEVSVDRELAEIVVQILDSIIEDLYSQPELVNRAMNYAQSAKLPIK